MSRVQPQASSQPHAPEPSPAPSVAIGAAVIDVLDIAYRARRPVLLEGPTGIGKSQIVEQFAREQGLDYRVLDLSLLEPPDLIGLPQLVDGRTHYAFPAELPTEGSGVLMLEELNRAEIPVMQPALQLLSARQLHAYELPPGWFCVAAINPEQGDYHVNRLDAALRSRFLQLPVHAELTSWLAWADSANVHPMVAQLVRQHASIFDTSAPRSWSYAAEVLGKLKTAELQQRDLVLALLRGYLPIAWATALTEALDGAIELPKLDVDQCLAADGASQLAAQVEPLLRSGRTDAVSMFAFALREAARAGKQPAAGNTWAKLAATLPGDFGARLLADADPVARRPGAHR